jgi:hypothetical protein
MGDEYLETYRRDAHLYKGHYESALIQIRELKSEIDNLRAIVQASIDLLNNDSCEYDDVRTFLEMASLAVTQSNPRVEP